MEAVVNVVQAQPEKYCKYYDVMMSYMSKMVMKKGYNMQSLYFAKTGCKHAKPKVTRKIECRNYPIAVWNSISQQQQMQVRKLHEQEGISLLLSCLMHKIAILNAWLGINSQPNKGDVMKNEGEPLT